MELLRDHDIGIGTPKNDTPKKAGYMPKMPKSAPASCIEN
jgi:hypothetical protein